MIKCKNMDESWLKKPKFELFTENHPKMAFLTGLMDAFTALSYPVNPP
jgi:hypothetical protein